MAIESGQIVKNLIPTESVVINKIQPLGSMVSITFTGINSSRQNSKVITAAEYENLEVLTQEGNFNFNGDPEKFKLFAEAERINSAYQFDPLFAVNCSIVDPLPHQVEAVYKYLLPQPKIRFLLADDTGAGKSIMTGLLIKELMMRGLAERILIITPGGLTKQWQEDEMQVKFNIPFTLVNRSVFNSEPNIFHTAKKIVTSIDFISREDILNIASDSTWDLIVFDEAHKLSAYDYGSKQYLSLRYQAAQKLSHQCEHILLLTATPHRGRQDTFKKLLQILDEDIFATEEIASNRVKDIESDGNNKFFIRRLKEDMKDWDGNPLFKNRSTKTVAYELTPEEKELYDSVTKYLTKRKEEAFETNNIHVSLALTVMQRRLVSSIFAIKNTLNKRHLALQGIVDELNRNPGLWSQRQKLDGFDVKNIDEYEDLPDDERESLENIMSDPRKFKLFTTAKSIAEIQQEAREVKTLFDLADNLYKRNQEEQKYKQLQELLKNNGVLENSEKLVIFTEHKDTLLYLEDRLSKSGGYKVATIHGGKLVDERRHAQLAFSQPETQILICTDAAGEGINLQFCRLLINWDIPWNPNRLEQRMGRIHRYGQKQDVIVFNMVASNTKEGKVLDRLLTKLDIIRVSMGDDRVYDVIQDVLENVKMDDIMEAIFDGKENAYTDVIDGLTAEKVKEKIEDQKNKLAHSTVDFKDARILKENSDEKRLQPIYIRLFFETAFKFLGGDYTEMRPLIYRIDKFPDPIITTLKNEFNIFTDNFKGTLFCFDKQVFLEYQSLGAFEKVHFINPGNQLFDSLISVVRDKFREEMLKGTVLISPDDKEEFIAFFVKSQITDDRITKKDDSIADERLMLVCKTKDGKFVKTSPAKFLDLKAPVEYAKPVEIPEIVNQNEVVQWSFENITIPQLDETNLHVKTDIGRRKGYLETAFTQVIADLQVEISDMQMKVFAGDQKLNEKLLKKQQRLGELIIKKGQRLQDLDLMTQLSPKAPQILGCAFVIPLTQVEYTGHYGMSRDDEAETIAMKTAMNFEITDGWLPEDVSANNEGYDVRSISPAQIKRYIEVKGRSGSDGSIMLSENEMNRLGQLGTSAWLYIVTNCKTNPELYRINNPAKLSFDKKTKGVQYFLPMEEWKNKSEN